MGNLRNKITYIEIDFDDIVRKKTHIIRNQNEVLAKIVFGEGENKD